MLPIHRRLLVLDVVYTMEETSGIARRRVVLFPCPLQGHINPTFQLAGLLRAKGFAITIIHPQFNAPDPSSCPYELITIPDGGLSRGSGDLVSFIELLNANCVVPFRDEMARILSAEDSPDRPPVACVVVDNVMYKIQAAAKQLGLPTLVLRTGSAATTYELALYRLLYDKGYLPVEDSKLELPVAEMPPLRVKDLLHMKDSSVQESYARLLMLLADEFKTCSGIIVNTFEAIEGLEVEKLSQAFGVPVFALGPMHKFSQSTQSSISDQEDSCMGWLDEQAPGSVLYVSFGSLASMDQEEFEEVAMGLVNSKRPFLWVVRSDSVHGGAGRVELPGELEEAIGAGRGMVVQWAPQQEVLSHAAVGGFWTHAGWNSTMESLSEGVPMLCLPGFSDQMGNARYVSHAWEVGVTLENGVRREEVEKAIKTLMAASEVDEAGSRMRERAKDMKARAAASIREGGSSYAALDKLVEHIIQSKKN